LAINVGDIVGIVFLIIIIIIFIAMSFRVVREWERAVVLRLGRFLRIKGPGIIFLIPFVDRPLIVDLRVNTVEVPPQTILTRDNVTVSVSL